MGGSKSSLESFIEEDPWAPEVPSRFMSASVLLLGLARLQGCLDYKEGQALEAKFLGAGQVR